MTQLESALDQIKELDLRIAKLLSSETLTAEERFLAIADELHKARLKLQKYENSNSS